MATQPTTGNQAEGVAPRKVVIRGLAAAVLPIGLLAFVRTVVPHLADEGPRLFLAYRVYFVCLCVLLPAHFLACARILYRCRGIAAICLMGALLFPGSLLLVSVLRVMRILPRPCPAILPASPWVLPDLAQSPPFEVIMATKVVIALALLAFLVASLWWRRAEPRGCIEKLQLDAILAALLLLLFFQGVTIAQPGAPYASYVLDQLIWYWWCGLLAGVVVGCAGLLFRLTSKGLLFGILVALCAIYWLVWLPAADPPPPERDETQILRDAGHNRFPVSPVWIMPAQSREQFCVVASSEEAPVAEALWRLDGPQSETRREPAKRGAASKWWYFRAPGSYRLTCWLRDRAGQDVESAVWEVTVMGGDPTGYGRRVDDPDMGAMVFMRGGVFAMGPPKRHHQVVVGDFLIGKYLVPVQA